MRKWPAHLGRETKSIICQIEAISASAAGSASNLKRVELEALCVALSSATEAVGARISWIDRYDPEDRGFA